MKHTHSLVFSELQAEDAKVLNSAKGASKPPNATVVRLAFISSFVLVIGSSAVGFLGALVLGWGLHCVLLNSVTSFQVIGTSLLLWGTLFVCG